MSHKISSLPAIIEPVEEDPNEENDDSDSPSKNIPKDTLKASPENSDDRASSPDSRIAINKNPQY